MPASCSLERRAAGARQQLFERLLAFADDHDVGAGVEVLVRVVRRVGAADDDAWRRRLRGSAIIASAWRLVIMLT